MYDNNFNRYGSMLQRPGGVDIDELRRRRASMDSRMSPMPVSPRPRPEEDEPQQESGAAQAIRQFSQMAATGLMGQAGDRPDASPASGSQARQMPLRGLPQMPGAGSLPNGGFTTPPLGPSTQRPSVAFERRQSPIPTVPALGVSTSGPPQIPAGDMKSNSPRLTRMPPQAAPAGPQGAAPAAAPTRPDPREIAQQEAMARTSAVDPISQAQEQAGMRSKRGFWDILKTAGVGALQGLSSGQGLGGALGGALAGGTIAAISPRRGGEYRFNMMERPRMEEEMNRRMQQEQLRRQQEQASLAGQKTAAEIQKLQAEAADIPGRTASQRAREAAQTEYYKGRAEAMRNPAPRPTRGDFALEVGADGKMYRIDRQTGNATPVEGFRPAPSGRGGRGGGGGGAQPAKPEKIVNLPEPLIKMLNDAEDLRLDAESAWGTAENDPQTGKPIAGSNAGEKLRKEYVQALNRIKQLFPDYVNVLPGVGEGGKALPEWPYVERRR